PSCLLTLFRPPQCSSWIARGLTGRLLHLPLKHLSYPHLPPFPPGPPLKPGLIKGSILPPQSFASIPNTKGHPPAPSPGGPPFSPRVERNTMVRRGDLQGLEQVDG